MTTKKTEMTAGEAIKKLKEKDGEPNNESARTNELLAARDGGSDSDSVKESLRMNDPTYSRSAHTSEKSGFNEDLEPTPADEPAKKTGGQTKAANR